MSSEQYLRDFEEKGYCIVENVLSIDQINALRATVQDLADFERSVGRAHLYGELYRGAEGTMQRVWNLLGKNQLFHPVLLSEPIPQLLGEIFDRPTTHDKYFLSSFQANILYPGAPMQNLHIDTPVPEPLPPWIIKANTIWALDEFTEQNGATGLVPGSHRETHKPRAGQSEIDGEIVACMKPGSVLLTHGALWHRSRPNASEQARIGLLGSFAASFAREIANEENHTLIIDRAMQCQMPPDLQRLIGFSHGIKLNSTIIR